MFGSSEDRARQLAGRRRKERIASLTSLLSQRSSSASSQGSQVGRQPSTYEGSYQPSTFSTKTTSDQTESAEEKLTEGVPSSDVLVTTSPMLGVLRSGNHCESSHRDRQQRLQAEYLSQVLFSTLNVPNVQGSLPTRPSLMPSHTRYSSLHAVPVQSMQLHDLTDATEPPTTHSRHYSADYDQPITSVMGLLSHDTFRSDTHLHAIASLRGGGEYPVFGSESYKQHPAHRYSTDAGDGNSERCENVPSSSTTASARPHIKEAAFIEEFPWVLSVYTMPEWSVPLRPGPVYHTFFSSLSKGELANFKAAFDSLPNFSTTPKRMLRRCFYRSLSASQKDMFRDLITEAGADLSRLRTNPGYKDSFAQAGSEYNVIVLLEQLLEATESPKAPLAWPQYTKALPDRLARRKDQATDPPNLQAPVPSSSSKQQQQQQQWFKKDSGPRYYSSGGGASTGATASKATLTKLFEQYRDASTDADVVGVEGTMKYFQEVGVDVEGLESLAALEIVQAPTMGEMTREGFVNGWQERSCDTIAKQKAYVQSIKKDLPTNNELFTRVYKYTFILAKTPGSKSVALDAAVAYWELLFSSDLSAIKWESPSTPWLSWWTDFLNSSWKKSVNKDMWVQTLKFAELTLADEAMSFWNEESSWPSVIDDFVDWVKKEKRGGATDVNMDEEY